MDLVSGRDVLLKIESIGAAVAQRAWAEGCARWYARRHPREPILHDYGVIGERLRFEAIEPAGTRWEPGATANGASCGGHVLQPRIAVARVAAWLDEPGDDRVRDVYICGPAGSGLATTGHLIAREARLLGFVPVHAAALASFSASVRDHAIDLLRERHLLVLRDASAPHEAEGMVLGRLARRAERPLVLVTLTRTAAPARSVFVALDPLDDGALARLIGGADAAARHRRRFRACVERSEGWPGRFLDAWRRTSDTRYTIRPQRALIAAERAAAYGSGEAVLDETAGEESAGEALAQAERLAGVGRHAAARAALKTCAGQLERRGAHRLLTRVRWALGRLEFDRGRVEEAIALFDHARDGFHAQGDEPRQTAATADLCRALMERGDLRRAESLARMTLAMGAASPPIAVCLAEALYWQGCYDEAEERLIRAGGTDDLATSALQARVALARGEIVEAGVCAQRALDCAGGAPDASRVSALVAAILVSGAVADTGRVAEHAAEGLRLARRAHQPRAAIDVRLARVEALARANDRRAARLAARGLARLRSTATPRLVRARIAAVMSALDGSPVAAHDLEGLNALIDLRAVLSGDGPPATRRRVRDDLRDLLDLAHDAPDETSALQRMASFVSRAVRHASVVVYGGEAPDVRAVAGSHVLTGPVPDVARRTMAAGILVGPSREREGVDVGCPIRFGGATIGAVFCRWMVEGPLDWTRIEVLLTAAACAAGPCLRAALDRTREQARTGATVDLIGRSDAMTKLREDILKAGPAPFAVLIEGESGSGKELVARAIHRASSRRDRKWCAVNCAALTDELLEAELFGHARGAFTGALADRAGLFEEADGGTLLLDEVGELSPRAQAKLLRTIQEGEVRRLGETVVRRIDVRIVAATNRRLSDEVAAGRFRQDLWYRLAVVRLAVPPLRARIEDVAELASEYWRRAAERMGTRAVLTAAVVTALARYDWPGNVRELQNVIAALAVAAPRRGAVTPSMLPDAVVRSAAESASTLDEARRMFERRFVRAALARAGGRVAAAARELGITRQGLSKLIARLETPGERS